MLSCNCQVSFVLRAAWGETKSKTPVLAWRSLMCFSLFLLVSCSPPTFKGSRPSGCFSPSPSRSALQRDDHIAPTPDTLPPSPACCFSHHADHFGTNYTFHVSVVWLPRRNVRSLRVRLSVCFVRVSPATAIVLAKGKVKAGRSGRVQSGGRSVGGGSPGRRQGVGLAFSGAGGRCLMSQVNTA